MSMSETPQHYTRRALETVVYHLPRIGIALIAVVPLLWVVSMSLRTPGLPPPRTIEWYADPLAWSNFARIFEIMPLASFLANSLIVVAIAVPSTLITASLAGFAMTQLPARTRNRLVLFSIMLMMVPATALWLTRFVLFATIGLIDSFGALTAPAIMGSSPLFVLLYYWSFRRIPAELFEAARLDGLGPVGLWAQIAMPLAWPATVAVMVLSFIFYWSDFFSPLLYMKSESRYTLPVGLQILQQMDKTNWPLLMAGVVVMTVPTIIGFLLIQRYFWPEGHRL
jgi:multiple sugar transport system permease protein